MGFVWVPVTSFAGVSLPQKEDFLEKAELEFQAHNLIVSYIHFRLPVYTSLVLLFLDFIIHPIST